VLNVGVTEWVRIDFGLERRFINSFIPDISIAPLEVHYY